MVDEEELRESLYLAVMDNQEVTLTSEQALVLWRLLGPPRRGFNVGDRVTWGSGNTSYCISHFHGEYAYMDEASGVDTATGKSYPDRGINDKAKIVSLRKA